MRRVIQLLDERDVPPPVRVERDRVIERLAGEALDRHRDLVPLLARHLTGFAADAHRGVGEESHSRLGLPAVGRRPRIRLQPAQAFTPARLRYSSTSASRARPRGRRPGRMSQVATLYSEMCTLLSSAIGSSSFAESPVTSPRLPQW